MISRGSNPTIRVGWNAKVGTWSTAADSLSAAGRASGADHPGRQARLPAAGGLGPDRRAVHDRDHVEAVQDRGVELGDGQVAEARLDLGLDGQPVVVQRGGEIGLRCAPASQATRPGAGPGSSPSAGACLRRPRPAVAPRPAWPAAWRCGRCWDLAADVAVPAGERVPAGVHLHLQAVAVLALPDHASRPSRTASQDKGMTEGKGLVVGRFRR
jgi:hypothetical protein